MEGCAAPCGHHQSTLRRDWQVITARGLAFREGTSQFSARKTHGALFPKSSMGMPDRPVRKPWQGQPTDRGTLQKTAAPVRTCTPTGGRCCKFGYPMPRGERDAEQRGEFLPSVSKFRILRLRCQRLLSKLNPRKRRIIYFDCDLATSRLYLVQRKTPQRELRGFGLAPWRSQEGDCCDLLRVVPLAQKNTRRGYLRVSG